MAIEQKRGCGYRKVGGLYMVGDGIGVPCDRLPYELTVCSCCGQGIKQARGWTWVDVAKLFQGPHEVGSIEDPESDHRIPQFCDCSLGLCPLCSRPETMGKAGLLWVGEKFYKTPAYFVKEGVEMGFSRRIKAVPQGFKVGETWVMLAHPAAIPGGSADTGLYEDDTDNPAKPGIFYVWLPTKLERLFLESQRNSPEVEASEKRGISSVFVPDDDVDHQGNVHDDLAREKREEKDDLKNDYSE